MRAIFFSLLSRFFACGKRQKRFDLPAYKCSTSIHWHRMYILILYLYRTVRPNIHFKNRPRRVYIAFVRTLHFEILSGNTDRTLRLRSICEIYNQFLSLIFGQIFFRFSLLDFHLNFPILMEFFWISELFVFVFSRVWYLNIQRSENIFWILLFRQKSGNHQSKQRFSS